MGLMGLMRLVWFDLEIIDGGNEQQHEYGVDTHPQDVRFDD